MFGQVDFGTRTFSPGSLGQLVGRLVVVVGGTTGVGRALAHEAAHRGADVLVVGEEFHDHMVPRIKFIQADLSIVEENARLGSDLPACAAVTIFANSVGSSSTRRESEEGIELQMAVSALSPHIILKGLAPRVGSRGRFVLINHVGSGNPGVLGDLNSEEFFTPGMGQTRMNVSAAGEALVHFWSSPEGGRTNIVGLNPGHLETNTDKLPVGGVFKGAAFARTQRFSLATSAEDFAATIMPLLVSPSLDQHQEASAQSSVEQHSESTGSVGSKRSWATSNQRSDERSSALQRQRCGGSAPLLLNAAGATILPTQEFSDSNYVLSWVSELDDLAVKAAENRTRRQELRLLEEQEQLLELGLLLCDDAVDDCCSSANPENPRSGSMFTTPSDGIGSGPLQLGCLEKETGRAQEIAAGSAFPL